MENLWGTNSTISNSTISGFGLSLLQDRLDALVMVLKTCKGEVCVKPWETLHPAGDVHTLKEAMSSLYDDFYASQPKVSFSDCALGYFPNVEGPQLSLPYISPLQASMNEHWTHFT